MILEEKEFQPKDWFEKNRHGGCSGFIRKFTNYVPITFNFNPIKIYTHDLEASRKWTLDFKQNTKKL